MMDFLNSFFKSTDKSTEDKSAEVQNTPTPVDIQDIISTLNQTTFKLPASFSQEQFEELRRSALFSAYGAQNTARRIVNSCPPKITQELIQDLKDRWSNPNRSMDCIQFTNSLSHMQEMHPEYIAHILKNLDCLKPASYLEQTLSQQELMNRFKNEKKYDK